MTIRELIQAKYLKSKRNIQVEGYICLRASLDDTFIKLKKITNL